MRRPMGAKIAAGCELLIFLMMLSSFLFIQDQVKMVDEKLPEISWEGDFPPYLVMNQNSFVLDFLGLMSYAILVIGFAHIILALLLWQGSTIGRYAATLLAVLDMFFIFTTLVFSIPIIYLIWFHKDTKEFYR
jgi:hypothetical protein